MNATFHEFFETGPVKGHPSLRKSRDERGVLGLAGYPVDGVR